MMVESLLPLITPSITKYLVDIEDISDGKKAFLHPRNKLENTSRKIKILKLALIFINGIG